MIHNRDDGGEFLAAKMGKPYSAFFRRVHSFTTSSNNGSGARVSVSSSALGEIVCAKTELVSIFVLSTEFCKTHAFLERAIVDRVNVF